MNANDVIESYVTEVAVQLPRKQRNDVAFELRALIDEGLQDRAAAAGRDADADMALEFVRAFGRPADVAARYRPALTIIDPADGPAFLRATVIGLAILWGLGLLVQLRQPIDSSSDLLTALGHWWTATVIASLWWPGVLVVSFGAAAWTRRKWPPTSEWRPRAEDRIHGSRAAKVLGLFGALGGLFVLANPHWPLDTFFGGRAARAAYDALTYTDTFRHRQAPWLFLLVALDIPLLINGIATGHWWPIMRRVRSGLALVTCAVLVWTVLDGPVLVAPAGDRAAKLAMVLIVASTLGGLGIAWYRSVRPGPNPPIRT